VAVLARSGGANVRMICDDAATARRHPPRPAPPPSPRGPPARAPDTLYRWLGVLTPSANTVCLHYLCFKCMFCTNNHKKGTETGLFFFWTQHKR
jgi:hypothetical protein